MKKVVVRNRYNRIPQPSPGTIRKPLSNCWMSQWINLSSRKEDPVAFQLGKKIPLYRQKLQRLPRRLHAAVPKIIQINKTL